jgi:subtilisin family serine protease
MKKSSFFAVALILTFLSLNLFSQTCNNPVAINDPYVSNADYNHALRLLDARCAWTITRGSRDIIVGVVDSEFDTTHEDLRNTFIGVGGSGTDTYLHGTPVSSCVATGTNNDVGIAAIGYNTRVKGYRAATVNGDAMPMVLWSQVLNAYNDGIKIINVSYDNLTGPTTDNIRQLVNDGVVLIVGAGNWPDAPGHQYAAHIPGVINVSGVNANNLHGPTWLARNSRVDVCALGTGVAVCSLGNTYMIRSGSSYAAPQVAGVVALMRSLKSDLTPAQIENIIKETAVPIADAHLFPGMLGAGRVNAFNAVKAVLCMLPPISFSGTVTTPDSIVNGSSVNVSGTTTVPANRKLTINACGGNVNITGDFTVQPGASLDINAYAP